MKRVVILLLTAISVLRAYPQDSIKGTLLNFETKQQITLSYKTDTPTVALGDDSKSGLRFYKVDKNGNFYIPVKDMQTFGKRINFTLLNFYGAHYNYADFEIHNIPNDSIKFYLSKVFLKPAYWINSCGSDCFLINNKKTFREIKFLVTTDSVRYFVNRIPENIKQSTLGVKYISELKKDIPH
jgi:hypothetical protein